MTGNSSAEEFSLYFHIPFCSRKCDYCHFYVIPDKESDKDKLLAAFHQEWELIKSNFFGKKLVSIYFGGGTPSLFGPKRIGALLAMIDRSGYFSEHIEITLEANPESLTSALMREYSQSGVNRVSLGIQTLDADLLQFIGRQHTPQIAERSIYAVKEAGIDNISIDLMYDLPNQSLRHWDKTLEIVSSLPITHLSLYNLTIEPHTLFFKRQHELLSLVPDEETSLRMYESAVEKLEKCDLFQYEISAFAKKGYQSKHNTGYWKARAFWGLGPSAFSYWNKKRFKNINNLNRYAQLLHLRHSPIDFEETLDSDAQRRELLVIRLRLKEGVPLDVFQNEFGPLETETKSLIKGLVKEGFLCLRENYLSLTKRGILFYDTVASSLI